MHNATSPRSRSFSRFGRSGLALAAAALLLAAGSLVYAGIGSGSGSGAGPTSKWSFRGGGGTARWEYAEFAIHPDRAVIVGDTALQEILPPRRLDARDTVYQNDAGPFIERFDLRLYYVNLVGGEGWEFVDPEPVKEGKAYVVRRPRK